MLRELFPGSTNFTGTIFKILQISKHFLAVLDHVSLKESEKFWSGHDHTN